MYYRWDRFYLVYDMKTSVSDQSILQNTRMRNIENKYFGFILQMLAVSF